MYSWKIVRRVLASLLLLAFAALNACDGEDRAMYDPSAKVQILELPEALTQARYLARQALTAQVQVDEQAPEAVPLMYGRYVQVPLAGFSPGSHRLRLTVFYQAGESRRVPLATLTRELDLQDGREAVALTRTEVQYLQGPDGDDIPNLIEVDQPQLDPDGDNLWNHEDTDSNNDGITDHQQAEAVRYRLQGRGVLVTYTDDQYEPNQQLGQATDLSTFAGQTLAGLVHADEDWYRVQVPAEQSHLYVKIGFDRQLGDMDLAIFNDQGRQVAVSSSRTDAQMIDLQLASRRTSHYYYLRVYSRSRALGNHYTLNWAGHNNQPTIPDIADDVYESNDNLAAFTDLSLGEGQWLRNLVHKNDDWYRLNIQPGNRRLQVILNTEQRGEAMALSLHTENGERLAYTGEIGRRKSLELVVPQVPGQYFLRVHAVAPSYARYGLYWRGQ